MTSDGLPAGTEIGGYEILSRLGSGGMSTVYLARDGGGHNVAFKLLHPHLTQDPAARERMRREVVALQRLKHAAIAQVLDAELDSAEAFIVTDFIDGPTLEEYVARNGPLDSGQLADLAESIYAALVTVHHAGLLHRDLKPSNVMMGPEGPVLIDFGIAHDEDLARVTSDGMVMGTPGYVPPEVLDGADPDVATDWWGLATICAFAATGRAPFGTRPLQAVLARSHAGDADLNGLPARTSLALAGALRSDPAERTTPMELVAELRAIHDGGQSTIALGTVNYTGPVRTRTIAAPGTTAVQPLGATPARPSTNPDTTQVIGPEAAENLAADPASAPTAAMPGPPGVPGAYAPGAGTHDGTTRVFGSAPDAGSAGHLDNAADAPTRAMTPGAETYTDGAPPPPVAYSGDGAPPPGELDAGHPGPMTHGTGYDAAPGLSAPAGPAGPAGPLGPTTDYRAADAVSTYVPSDSAADYVPGALPGEDSFTTPTEPAYIPPVLKRRWGTVLAFAVMVIALGAVAPFLAIGAGVLLTVIARTAGLTLAAADADRIAGKERPAWKSALSTPWHFLRALATVLPSVIVGASLGVIVAGLGLWALDTGRIAVAPANEIMAYAIVQAVAVGLAMIATWFGPFSVPQREGARWLLARVAPGMAGSVVVWAVAIVVVFLVVMGLIQGHTGTWWPLTNRPTFS